MQWKQIVYEKVHTYWKEQTIRRISELYTHLGYLNIYEYKPGEQHPLICIPISSVRVANRIPVKLKLVSGTYEFQANRGILTRIRLMRPAYCVMQKMKICNISSCIAQYWMKSENLHIMIWTMNIVS